MVGSGLRRLLIHPESGGGALFRPAAAAATDL